MYSCKFSLLCQLALLTLWTAWILGRMYSPRRWKHSSDFPLPLDMIASRSCQRFCLLHIHATNRPLYHYWVGIWWLLWLLEYTELVVVCMEPAWDNLCCVTWCFILLEVAIRRWLYCGRKGMHTVSSSTRLLGCGTSEMLSWYLGAYCVPRKCCPQPNTTTSSHGSI